MIKTNPYAAIPTIKLEKIHYAQLRIIKERELTGDTAGLKIKINNPSEAQAKLSALLKGIFTKSKPGENEDLLGLHYYVDTLKMLPLANVKKLEIETAQEIKKRRELTRQKLDAGNIDKLVKG